MQDAKPGIAETDAQLIIIHGLGVEGRAALPYFLERCECPILLVDTPDKTQGVIAEHQDGERLRATSEQGFVIPPRHDKGAILYLRSPGIPPTNPVFSAIRQAGIVHTTPTGYWLWRHAPKGTITITGTKGKSSTASLTASLLRWTGTAAEEMGNIGRTPFEAAKSTEAVCVFELSSYMMHDLLPADIFHVVTSLYTEHTDWHGSHEAYASDKLRPWLMQPPAPGLTTRAIASYLKDMPEGVRYFEDIVPITAGTLFLGGGMTLRPADYNDAFKAPTLVLALRAAIAIVKARGLAEPEAIFEALEAHLPGWAGLASRQEIIPTTDGRLWVDDALATVPEATESALARWARQPIHLILGGRDRGQSFTDLLATCALRQDVQVYAFGATATKIREAADEVGILSHCAVANSLEDAIGRARRGAREGEIILFSPGASSQDVHGNYKVRSSIFRHFAEGKS